jgi:hypothetical protein
MARVPDIDEAMDDKYQIPIKYIEEDGWEEDFFYEEIKTHPPESFRDKSNGE